MCTPYYFVEPCFLPFINVLDGEEIPVDEIEFSIDCLRIQRQITEAQSEQTTSREVYDLSQANNLKKLVHVERAAQCIENFQPKLHRRRLFQEQSVSEGSRTSCVFYLDDYFIDKSDT